MRIYLVRHGESLGNAAAIHQFAEMPLSPVGRRQAAVLADTLASVEIDHILASPMPRARQTAKIIARKLGRHTDYSDLLVAIRRPSEFFGRKTDDPEVLKIKDIISQHYHEENYRYSDEETFSELKKRGMAVLELVSSLGKENVLVVAHGAITRMIVSLILLGEDLLPSHFLRLSDVLLTHNAGITVCERSDLKNWRLVTWNNRPLPAK
jgi:broad specificity phosphatase PhoE